MYLNWNERLAISPELWEFNNWPDILTSDIPKQKRSGFLTNRKIVAQVLIHRKARIVALEFGVGESKISKLMSRCLAGNADEDPPLMRALVPHIRLTTNKRRSSLSTVTEPSGAAGAFQHLLKLLPKLKIHLDKVLSASFKDKPESQHITPYAFFNVFLNHLKEHQWPSDKYPFTEKNCGYESVRLYMHMRLSEMSLHKIITQQPKPWVRISNVFRTIFEEIQIDEHTYDTNCSIHLDDDGHLEPLRISRLSLLISVDVATDTKLSYILCLNRSPNQDDVLDCLAGIYRPWQRKNLTCPGIEYAPNAGFPCGTLFDDSNAPAIAEISLDNALVHSAFSVRNYITDTLGGTCNLGLPRNPKDRNWVEFAFKLVADSAHRFNSTTGSHSQDPKKESRKNSKEPPIVSLRAIEEIIEVQLAQNNTRSKAYLGSRSSLETMQYQLAHRYIPRLSVDQFNAAKAPIDIQFGTVRFDPTEGRLPHINFLYVRYTGTCLDDPELLNKTVEIHVDKHDVRSCEIYKNGKYIGEVRAPKSWQRFKHSLRTRNCIFNLTKARVLKEGSDPLTNYFNYILEHRELPENALELVRITREYSSSGQPFFVPKNSLSEEDNTKLLPEISIETKNEMPEWTPQLTGIKLG